MAEVTIKRPSRLIFGVLALAAGWFAGVLVCDALEVWWYNGSE